MNIEDNTGHVYRSAPVIWYKTEPAPTMETINPVTGITYDAMFGLIGTCDYTLMPGVGSIDFTYVDSPNAQSF